MKRTTARLQSNLENMALKKARELFLKAHDANGRNIWPNVLRPFVWNHNNVGTCWDLLRIP